jgi:putative salt-induced outer membrane protein YdiY
MKNVFIAGVCACTMVLGAVAQDEKPDGFKSSLSAGVTMTDGNSETLQGNAAISTEGEKIGLGSVRAGIEANYGESTVDEEKDKTVDNTRVFANAKKTISPKTFASLDGSVLTDDISEIDYRATFGPGLGFYLIKNSRNALSLDVSPTYVWEKVAGVSEDYLALKFAERFEHAISETAKLWQSAEYLPKVDDFGDYLLETELGAEAALNTRMSLRVVLRDKYDSTPGADLEKNDLTLISGITVSL